MKFTDYFDAVVMLTWSDWDNEPRSNRYHFATRFAKVVPTFFLQNQAGDGESIRLRALPDAGDLTIVDVSAPIRPSQIDEVRALIASRGIKRPLLWVYDSRNYTELLTAFPRALRAYHATEDYCSRSEVAELRFGDRVRESVRSLMREIDLVVAVTEKVAESLVEATGFTGKTVISRNGCDYPFFAALAKSVEVAPATSDLTVVYQGTLNARIDYDLLCDVIRAMPDARFRFFGKTADADGVSRLRAFPNTEILGAQPPESFGKGMLEATVGIIPFVQDVLMRNSLPLKAYEYVACGLPVVSIPIDALQECTEEGVFEFATTAKEFVASIRHVAASRLDPELLTRRDRIAQAQSYDDRFDYVVRHLVALAEERSHSSLPLNIAILVDAPSIRVGTIHEHLSAFERYSKNLITFLPSTYSGVELPVGAERFAIELSMFDVVIMHYTVRLSVKDHLDQLFANALERFAGLKILFIQDEYDSVECARSWMDRIGFDLVYTCVPLAERQKVYPDYRFPATEFFPTLTGFVPEHEGLDAFALPLEARKIVVGYRGRDLPAIYGLLGHEKYRIGIEFRHLAEAAGLNVDIACDGDSRIYGDDWYRFLGSVRATLGTESGSNVFDFDGSLVARIKKLQAEDPTISFEEIWARVLCQSDGAVHMNQISPKIFEAIRLRTALILFEGEYSGVVKPDLHFIPLKKDFSNFDEVVAKVLDDEYVRQLTVRAYEDVVESRRYSYRRFVEGVDEQIRWRSLHRRSPGEQQFLAVISFDEAGELRQCLPAISLSLRYSSVPFERGESAYGFQQKVQRTIARQVDAAVATGLRAHRNSIVLRTGVQLVRNLYAAVSHFHTIKKAVLRVYYLLPEGLKSKLRKINEL